MEIILTLKKSCSVSMNFLHSKNCDLASQIAKIKRKPTNLCHINKYYSR